MSDKLSADNNFGFDPQKILAAIEAAPREERDVYPSHIYEPERIEILRELVLKEFYKLLRFLDADDFENMGDTMTKWLTGHGFELAPIADYWNFLDGIMISLKLKDIGPSLTSQNINWQLTELDPKVLSLSSPVGTVREDCQHPFTYDEIKSKIIDNPERLTANLRISDEKASDTLLPRDSFPIVVRQNYDKTYALLDGNRRTLRAWLKDKPTITAWVGTVTAEPMLKNHWVATPFLRRLLALYATSPTPGMEQAIRTQLKLLFESSAIAKHHYKTRCLPHYSFAAKLADGLL